MDTSASPAVVESVFVAASQTWNNFQVGSFRRTESGLAVAESLTGVDLAFRTSDTEPFQDGYGWWGAGAGPQILDLVEFDGDLFGCGSTINTPPHVFLPNGGPAPGLASVPLTDAFRGELWGLAVDADGIVAVGVDQEAADGTIFLAPVDASEAGDFELVRFSTWFGDTSTWARGVCRDGASIAVVGEFSQRGEGIVLLSEDGGESFEDVTPDGAPSLDRCVWAADGALHVAGGSGFYGVL
jgi:hypothetical protein